MFGLKKRVPFILLIIFLFSCGEGELEVIDNECNSTVRFKQEKDMLEVYGDSFVFRNINSQQQKEFKYSASGSSSNQFNDTILCTHLTFDDQTILKYVTGESSSTTDSDFITYVVHQYFDGRQDFGHRISQQFFTLNGKIRPDLRQLTNKVILATEDESNYMLVYVNDEGVFEGFDDLEDEKWLLSSASEDIFYCEVEDNLDKYKQTEEYEAFQTLANKTLKYSDGSSPTLTFQNESHSIFFNYRTIENNDCPEQKLLINQEAQLILNHRFQNIYNFDWSITPTWQDPTSDKKYTSISLTVRYLIENKIIHRITFVIDPDNIFNEDLYPTPFVYHDEIKINDIDYNDVYEFSNSNDTLFFNYDHGIIAFTDHRGVINYQVVE